MKPFPIHIVGFVVVRCNDANVGPVHTSNHAQRPSAPPAGIYFAQQFSTGTQIRRAIAISLDNI